MSFTGLKSNPFQGMSRWHSNGGVIKRTVRSRTLRVKSTVFRMIEGTFHVLTIWEVMAELTTGRWYWCSDGFWRQSWDYLAHVSEGTVWFSPFCIIFTIWMNRHFSANLQLGKALQGDTVPVFAGRPVLVVLQELFWLLCQAQFTHLSI